MTRSIWKPYAPPIPYITAPGTIPEPVYRLGASITDYVDSFRYQRLPTSSFQDDAEAGLHSSNFNLAENIEAEDGRRGLDEEAKRRRKEQEERELIMDRLLEEEQAQEEADARVSVLKSKLEALKRNREAARAAKAKKAAKS